MVGLSKSSGWSGTAVVATIMIAASACGGGSTSSSSSGNAPIKVAFELPLTGNFAANAQNEQNGFELGLDTFGRDVNGHPIQVSYADTKGDPATALTSARKLVQDGVTVFEGPLVASEAAATTPILAQSKTPLDDLTLCSEVQLDSWQKTPNALASGWSCDQPAMLAAQYAYEEKGWRNITIAAQDFSFGWEVAGGFKAAFEKLGGTITSSIWVPLTATDLSSYVSQIPGNTDAVYAEMSGAAALKFTSAYKSFGLTGKVPLLGITQLTDQSVLPQEDPAAVTGVLTGAQYCDGIDTPENKKFVDAYKAKFNALPGYYSDAGYVKAQVVVAAMTTLKGDPSDPVAVAKAMRAVSITAPRGPVKISDQTFSPIQNVYICQVKSVDGALRNVPIKTYENVKPEGPLDYATWEKHFRHDSAARP
jgi:branched-chain amino acid transport system substrate-binding protein